MSTTAAAFIAALVSTFLNLVVMVVTIIQNLFIRIGFLFQDFQCCFQLSGCCPWILTVQNLQCFLHCLLQLSTLFQFQEVVISDPYGFLDRLLQLLSDIVHFFYIILIIGVHIRLSSDRSGGVKLLKPVLIVAPAFIAVFCSGRAHKVFHLIRHLAVHVTVINVIRRLLTTDLKGIAVPVLNRQHHGIYKVHAVRPIIYHHIPAANMSREGEESSRCLRVIVQINQTRFRLAGGRVFCYFIQLVIQHIDIVFSHLYIGPEGSLWFCGTGNLSSIDIPFRQHLQSPGTLICLLMVLVIVAGGFYRIGFRCFDRVLFVHNLIRHIGAVYIDQLPVRVRRQFFLQPWNLVGIQRCFLPAPASHLIHDRSVAR